MEVEDTDRICCKACGYAQRSDAWGFFRLDSDHGEEIRYVSDWSKWIYRQMQQRLEQGEEISLITETDIQMIDEQKHKFVSMGRGILRLDQQEFCLSGKIGEEEICIRIPVGSVPTLPFKPGKYLEVQHGKQIYRCALSDGRLVMKYINLVKILYRIRQAELEKVT